MATIRVDIHMRHQTEGNLLEWTGHQVSGIPFCILCASSRLNLGLGPWEMTTITARGKQLASLMLTLNLHYNIPIFTDEETECLMTLSNFPKALE